MKQLFSLTKEVLMLVEQHERFRITLKNIKSHTETQFKCDELELDFEVIGLPQYRLIQVQNVEPITICISEGNTAPIVKVRDDFPTVPHLNIHKDNITKSLCYLDVRYEEIMHKMSGRYLLTCIENWFLKTSMKELHQPDQPLEPFFFYVNDIIIWDKIMPNTPSVRFETEHREFGEIMFQSDKGSRYVLFNLCMPQDYSNLIHKMPQTLYELIHFYGDDTTVITWINSISKIIKNVNLFNKYFGQMKNLLLNCKAIITVGIPKSREENSKIESCDCKSFVTDNILKDILLSYGFVLNGSKIESKNITKKHGNNITIKPYNFHLKNSKQLNKRANLIDEECGNEKITLVGTGAIGSHILNNFLRAGYGKWTIIDCDYFWPHNIARHILTDKSIGQSKVKALENFASSIQVDSDIVAINGDIFSKNESILSALTSADIIVDVSASIAVERYLALDIESKARQLSCFLNPKGTATILLLKSTDGTDRLDLLEMQYYREIISNEKYSDHMMIPESMTYSGSCRSISSRMSQDNVSLGAALCSKALKTHISDERGKIIIWTHKNDSVSRDIFLSDNWITYQTHEWTIEIAESLLKDIKNERLQSMPCETGGVLIGTYDLSRKRVYIVCEVKAPEDSMSYPNSFIRGCMNLPEQLEAIHRKTLGNLSYIGEWHSHINDNTQKSADDQKLHDAIVDYNHNNCIPGCMMIVGSNGFSVYVKE
ncbi:hypothetical protein HDR58_00685 [bacterium]|nr:hypothetical protein [bacterium]